MLPTRLCQRCPDKWVTWVRLLVSMCSIPLLLRALLYALTSINSERMHMSLMNTRKLQRTKGLFDVALGHVQVMSQHMVVFDVMQMPPVFQDFMRLPALLSLDLLYWCGLTCVLYHTSEAVAEEHAQFGTFYATFWLYAIAPFVVATPVLHHVMRVAIRQRAFSYSGSAGSAPDYHEGATPSEESKLQTSVPPSVEMQDMASVPRKESVERMKININPAFQMVDSSSIDVNELHKMKGRRLHTSQVNTASFEALTSAESNPSGEEVDGEKGNRKLEAVELVTIVNPKFSDGSAKFVLPSGEPANLNDFEPRDPNGSAQAGEDSDGWMAQEGCEAGTEDELYKDQIVSGKGDKRKERLLQAASRLQRDPSTIGHPHVALASFLLVFLHPTVSTCMLQVFNCDHLHFDSSSREYFLRLDRSHACFTSEWWLYATVSSLVIVVYTFGLPCGFCFLCFHLYKKKRVITLDGDVEYVLASKLHVVKEDRQSGRGLLLSASTPVAESFEKETADGERVEVFPVFIQDAEHRNPIANIESKLLEPKVQGVLGPFITPFKDKHFYWTFYEISRRIMATSMVIFVQMLETDEGTDLLYALLVATLALLVHCYVRPYKSSTVNWFQMLILLSQSVTVTGYIADGYLLAADETACAVSGIILMTIQSILAIMIAGYIALDLYPLFCDYVQKAYNAAKEQGLTA